MPSREELYDAFLEMDGSYIELVVERTRDQHGRSFSVEAMEGLNDQVITWIGTRIMRRWNATNEPPTLLRVELRVTVG